MDGMLPDLAISNALPYGARLQPQSVSQLEFFVIHCTELPDLAVAREYALQLHYSESRTGNSGHFYIDRDGTIEQWVPLNRIAHHVRDNNNHSIGIELVNRGRFPDWLDSRHQQMTEPYPEAQIKALIRLLTGLRQAIPNASRIAGHESLDTQKIPATDNPGLEVYRKRDPGPLFPWKSVLDATRLQRFGETP
jgi:N-acetylmuramoyl-L-alanine amidase